MQSFSKKARSISFYLEEEAKEYSFKNHVMVDASDPWSWPLPLSEASLLKDDIRNKLALLCAQKDLKGLNVFFFYPCASFDDEIIYHKNGFIGSKEGFDDVVPMVSSNITFEDEGVLLSASAKKDTDPGMVAYCGGCGALQRVSDSNRLMCRFGHLQSEGKTKPSCGMVPFKWKKHNVDRRCDMLICGVDDKPLVEKIMERFHQSEHDEPVIIPAAERDVESFMQVLMSTCGGGIVLVILTKKLMESDEFLTNNFIHVKEVSDLCRVRILLLDIDIPSSSEYAMIEEVFGNNVTFISNYEELQKDFDTMVPGFRRDQSFKALQALVPGAKNYIKEDANMSALKKHLQEKNKLDQLALVEYYENKWFGKWIYRFVE